MFRQYKTVQNTKHISVKYLLAMSFSFFIRNLVAQGLRRVKD